MIGTARAAAAAAAVAVPAGFGTVAFALSAGPGLWSPGYVSEAGLGIHGAAYGTGMLLVAAGVLLLGVSLAPVSRAVAALLVVSAAGAGTSGAVPCSPGCPLPPYEPATAADLVHGGAAIGGMAALALAMLLLAATPAAAWALRRVAGFGALVLVPLGVLQALTMLVLGRGATGGVVERVMLCVVTAWLTGAAALRLRTTL
ncbi:hypothetical protein GCM10009524_18570 [Spirilliplanes yamanashiensis]